MRILVDNKFIQIKRESFVKCKSKYIKKVQKKIMPRPSLQPTRLGFSLSFRPGCPPAAVDGAVPRTVHDQTDPSRLAGAAPPLEQ